MESLSPNIFVKDINETIDFYKQLGFQLVMSVPEDGSPLVWAMVMNGNVNFMFQTFASLGDDLPTVSRKDGGSLLFYIKLKNILSFFEEIKDKVTVVKGIEKHFTAQLNFPFLITTITC